MKPKLPAKPRFNNLTGYREAIDAKQKQLDDLHHQQFKHMTAGRKKEFDYMNGPINHARAEKKALETERYKLVNDWFDQGREQPKAPVNKPKPSYNTGMQHAYGNIAPKSQTNAGAHAYAIGTGGVNKKPSALDSYNPNKPHGQQWTPEMEKEHREIRDRLVNGGRSGATSSYNDGMQHAYGNMGYQPKLDDKQDKVFIPSTGTWVDRPEPSGPEASSRPDDYAAHNTNTGYGSRPDDYAGHELTPPSVASGVVAPEKKNTDEGARPDDYAGMGYSKPDVEAGVIEPAKKNTDEGARPDDYAGMGYSKPEVDMSSVYIPQENFDIEEREAKRINEVMNEISNEDHSEGNWEFVELQGSISEPYDLTLGEEIASNFVKYGMYTPLVRQGTLLVPVIESLNAIAKSKTVDIEKIGGMYAESYEIRKIGNPKHKDVNVPVLYQYAWAVVYYSSQDMTPENIVYVDVIYDGGPRLASN